MRMIRRSTIGSAAGRKASSRGGFNNFGEFLHVVARAEHNPVAAARLRAAQGGSVGDPGAGGFLVPDEMADPIVAHALATGQILSRVTPLHISAGYGGTKVPSLAETARAAGSRYGGAAFYWEGEADQLQTTHPEFKLLSLTPKKVSGLVYATEEMLQDASVMDFIATNVFSEELTFKAEEAIIEGTGAGMPLGILRSTARIAVAKEGSQAANTIVYANLKNMWSRLAPAGRSTAVWLINQDVEPQLLELNEKLAAAGMPPVYAAAPGQMHIFGVPVIPCEHCPTLGTEGDIVLTDLSQYILADKPAQQVLSMHVRFAADESVFRTTWRLDGAPLWSSPITPKNSASTVSPIVTLETRA